MLEPHCPWTDTISCQMDEKNVPSSMHLTTLHMGATVDGTSFFLFIFINALICSLADTMRAISTILTSISYCIMSNIACISGRRLSFGVNIIILVIEIAFSLLARPLSGSSAILCLFLDTWYKQCREVDDGNMKGTVALLRLVFVFDFFGFAACHALALFLSFSLCTNSLGVKRPFSALAFLSS